MPWERPFTVRLTFVALFPEPALADAVFAPYAVVVQVKTEINRGGGKEAADLRRVLDILRSAHYRGYVALEYEAADLHVPDEVELGRGYFDLAEHAPGPITRTEDELLAALVALPHQPAYVERRKAFARRFGEHDRGTAARTVVDRYFKEGSRRG